MKFLDGRSGTNWFSIWNTWTTFNIQLPSGVAMAAYASVAIVHGVSIFKVRDHKYVIGMFWTENYHADVTMALQNTRTHDYV